LVANAAPPSPRPDFEEINERLDGIIIDSAIEDEVARTFWKADASLYEYALPWPVFARKLWRFLGLELPHDPDDPLPAEEPATQPGQDKWYACPQTRVRLTDIMHTHAHSPHTPHHTHTTGPRPTNEQQRQRLLPAEDPSKAEWARRPCTIRRLLPRWRS
jgi:hypothetical protein